MSLILLHQPQFPHSLLASCMYTGKKKKRKLSVQLLDIGSSGYNLCVQDSFFIFSFIQQLTGLQVCEWRAKGMQQLGVE